MERTADTMTIEQLRHAFVEIDFPEYQREPDIWTRVQKQRLIDSIFRQFDIASIYLYRRDDGGLECIDGRQRLNAIMSFLGENPLDGADNEFPLKIQNEISESLTSSYHELDGRTYAQISGLESSLAQSAVKDFLNYSMTVVYLSSAKEADEFNLQFLRLNLGTLINAGEKLHAMVGGMRDLIFKSERIGQHPFFEQIRIPTRRYAREQVAAQVMLQLFSKAEHGEFGRARHFDLQKFLKAHADVAEDHPQVVEMGYTLDALDEHVSEVAELLRNRAMTVSFVLLAWDESLVDGKDALPRYREFSEAFLGRLRWQVGKMKEFAIDERYSYLAEFQRHLTQASVEKPAVTHRHELLLREWRQWLTEGVLTGDKEYREATGDDPPVA